jgi:hypothetical protein
MWPIQRAVFSTALTWARAGDLRPPCLEAGLVDQMQEKSRQVPCPMRFAGRRGHKERKSAPK